MSQADEQRRRRAERARQVGLFRYELIQDVIDPQLSARQRGKMVRELAQATHIGPFGHQVRLSRQTIDPWIRAWRVICHEDGTGVLPREWDHLVGSASMVISVLCGVK